MYKIGTLHVEKGKNITICKEFHDESSDNDENNTKPTGTFQENGASDDDNGSQIFLHPTDDIDVDNKLGVPFLGQILMQCKQ